MRVVGCFLAGTVLAACSISDPGAGSPYPGHTSTPPTPPASACSTGTQVVLVDPVPGSHVSSKLRKIKIASSGAITTAKAALSVVVIGAMKGEVRALYGPVPAPTSSPAAPIPFPSPAYYAARGFSLEPARTYVVQVAVLHSACKITTIDGAKFRTSSAPN